MRSVGVTSEAETREEQSHTESPEYLPNLHNTLDHDGNAESSRSGKKKFQGQICPDNFGVKVVLVLPGLPA